MGIVLSLGYSELGIVNEHVGTKSLEKASISMESGMRELTSPEQKSGF